MPRLEMTYRLDTTKAHEREILPIVDELMSKKSYSRAIRVGLKIFWEALQGKSDTLKREFPQLVEMIVHDALQNALNERHEDQLEQIMNLLKQQPQAIPIPASNAPKMPPLPARGLDENLLANTLEIKPKTTKGSNSGRILILQVLLASSLKNIELFTPEDLELVTDHPAFNQTLIKTEQAKRKKEAGQQPVASQASSPPIPIATSKKIKGAEIEFTAPDFNDLQLL